MRLTLEVLESRSLLSLFGSPLVFPVGLRPWAPIAADFDGDGKQDLAFLSSDSSGQGSSVNVLRNNGFGGFAAPVSYNVPGVFTQAVGDFNGDRRPDLAVATTSTAGGNLAVLLNRGDGTLAAPLILSALTLSPYSGASLAVADFFSDGTQDLAVLNGGTLRVLRNDGHANFTLAGSVAAGDSRLLAVGYFNGDSLPDLVTYSTNGLTGLLNQGGGTFTLASPKAISFGVQSLAVGDFNRDGRADVVVVNQANLTVGLLLGKGDGTFNAPGLVSGPGIDGIGGSASVVAGDFNNDGKLDIAECIFSIAVFGRYSSISNVLTVLLGNGDGTFQDATSLSLGGGSSSANLAVGDFNGDGQPDFAVCAGGPTYPPNASTYFPNDRVSVVLNTSKDPISGSYLGAFDPATATWYLNSSPGSRATDVPVFQYGTAGWAAVVGDWDGNGTATIGVVDPASMTWYLRNANSPGAPDYTPFTYGLPGWVPVVGDWTGSGHAGIGAFDPNTGTWYLRNEDSPGPADMVFHYGGANWVPVVGDWDGNGTTTVGVVDPRAMTWYLRNANNPGAPNITPFQYGGVGWKPVVGDWTSQGRTTVGVVDPATLTWYLRNSNSAGTPDVAAPFTYGQSGWTPLAGHFNATAHASIGMFDPATATWYLRNETGAGVPDAGVFQYGAAGWIPVVGDWTGTGHTGIGVVDPATMTWYLRNEDSPGPADIIFQYGAPGWIPVVGHWAVRTSPFGAVPLNTGIGVVDPAASVWYLRNEVSAGPPDAGVKQVGAPGWIPVSNGWIGTNQSVPVTVDPGSMTWYVSGNTPPLQFQYGGVGWRPIMGDWNGDGSATAGAVDPNGVWYLSNYLGFVPPDIVPFAYGLGSWIPLVGNWLVVASTDSQAIGMGRTVLPARDGVLIALSELPAVLPPDLSAPSGPTPPNVVSPSPVVGEQSLRPWSSAPPSGTSSVRHAYLSERVRTAALDALFATGLE